MRDATFRLDQLEALSRFAVERTVVELDNRADVHRRARRLEQDEGAVERVEELRHRPLLPKPPVAAGGARAARRRG